MKSSFVDFSFVFALFAILSATRPISASPTSSFSTLERRGDGPQWSGIEKLFVFGASYANTFFKSGPDDLPSPARPWGNSGRSTAGQGTTNANGPNFVMYLTDTFNDSQILTYNFAFPGASISRAATGGKPGNDLVEQVQGTFRSAYTPDGARAAKKSMRTQWQSDTSLFLFFFGINDLQAVYSKENYAALLDKDFEAYEEQLDALYTSGARNFLLLNTPPMEIMPDFTAKGGVGTRVTALARRQIKRSVEAFNARLSSLIISFQVANPEASIAVFDTHALFTEMQSSLEAANALTEQYGSNRIEHLDDACPAYSKDGEAYLGSDDFFDESCEVPVSAYYWLNRLHPTWSVHKVMAGRIAEFLSGWSP
ncbi:MAG: hypothetical protein Q9215_004305 [Flavoplaca cf. flavocitrina]